MGVFVVEASSPLCKVKCVLEYHTCVLGYNAYEFGRPVRKHAVSRIVVSGRNLGLWDSLSHFAAQVNCVVFWLALVLSGTSLCVCGGFFPYQLYSDVGLGARFLKEAVMNTSLL